MPLPPPLPPPPLSTTTTTTTTITQTQTQQQQQQQQQQPITRLSHRHQPSNLSFSSASSSSSSTRPALPQILTNSASNAVNFSRSTAPTSRRVRSHWFTHFVLNWRRSSRSSKLLLACSMTLVAIQVIASIAVLFISWEMYCDKPLRIFVTVYILRLVLTAPINIYTHLAPRSRPMSSPRTSARSELSEAYAMSERNRPVSFPPPVMPSNTNRQHHYPPFITPSNQTMNQQQQQQQQWLQQQLSRQEFLMDENALKAWIDRAKSALDLFAVLWFIIGNYMIFTSSTCSDTASPLYYFSLVLIIYGYLILSVPIFLCTSVIFCLPCVLVGMRLLHVDDGVYMGGATTEEIAMIPVYQFKSSTSTTNNTNIPPPLSTSTLNQHTQSFNHHHHHHYHMHHPTTTTTTATTTSTTLTSTNINPSSNLTTTITNSSMTSHTMIEEISTASISPVIQDDYITIDLHPKPSPMIPITKQQQQQQQQHHHHHHHKQQKPGMFDKLWLYLGLMDPPSEIEPEFEILEIPDVQDQVCVICLSTYEDGDLLCKLWCGHHYHKPCLHEWLALNFRCPMCKQDSRGKDIMIDV